MEKQHTTNDTLTVTIILIICLLGDYLFNL